MIDNFEFSDTKQVRKTLIITSFAGICFKALVKNSTGHIEFFGFKIPVQDASVIPYFVGGIIIFEIIALIIRYSDESARKKYANYLKYIQDNNMSEINRKSYDDYVPQILKPNYSKNEIIKRSVFFFRYYYTTIIRNWNINNHILFLIMMTKNYTFR
jgi:hypothetical protein